MKLISAFSIVSASIPVLAIAGPLNARQNVTNQTMITDFSQLTASPTLDWTPCYENFTCTLLEVPLDYTNETIGTTSLAIIRFSSQNESAEDLLFNPGGPGASAVDLITSIVAPGILAKVGTQYNIIGIDPRGVGASGPDLSCFPGYPASARNAFYAEVFTVREDISAYGMQTNFQTYGAYGDWCTGIYSVNNTAKYTSTVAVVNDHLRYIELAAQDKGCEPSDAKLNFYGVSYGTVIGATFASLYPDRVNRMLLDGVVDLEDYYTGRLETYTITTDDAVREFFRTCFEAGPDLCMFHQNATSPEQLEERFNAILETLRMAPVPVANPFPSNIPMMLSPSVFTSQDILTLAAGTLAFTPVSEYPILDFGLTLLEAGDSSGLIRGKAASTIARPLDGLSWDTRESRTLVQCLDANRRLNISTIEEYTEYIGRAVNQSEYGGRSLAAIGAPLCRNMDISSPESQVFDVSNIGSNTSTPIMFIGNTFDPLTPLRSAMRMSEFFSGSTVLTANSSGHSQFNSVSQCVDAYTQQYFLDGTLPPPDTVCELDEPNPFVAAAAIVAAQASAMNTTIV